MVCIVAALTDPQSANKDGEGDITLAEGQGIDNILYHLALDNTLRIISQRRTERGLLGKLMMVN